MLISTTTLPKTESLNVVNLHRIIEFLLFGILLYLYQKYSYQMQYKFF